MILTTYFEYLLIIPCHISEFSDKMTTYLKCITVLVIFLNFMYVLDRKKMIDDIFEIVLSLSYFWICVLYRTRQNDWQHFWNIYSIVLLLNVRWTSTRSGCERWRGCWSRSTTRCGATTPCWAPTTTTTTSTTNTSRPRSVAYWLAKSCWTFFGPYSSLYSINKAKGFLVLFRNFFLIRDF